MNRSGSAVLLGLSLIACGAAPTDVPSPRTPATTVARTTDPNALAFVADATPVDPNEDAPRISLEGDRVLVDGKVAALIVDPTAFARIDALYTVLRACREAWKTNHPNQDFPGFVELLVPATTRASILKSLFMTAAYAGYPIGHFLVLREGGLGYLSVDAAVPRPPVPATAVPVGTSPSGPPVARGSLVNGRLAPEVIQRTVRATFGGFRLCYERALKSNPLLKGRVSVKFVIELDGHVVRAQDAGSELPDADVVACVVKQFATLVFPPPEGGIVTVVYPIIFTPGDQ
jgi:hypothetical protein